MWDMDRLAIPPETFPAEGFHAEGVKALFYEGLPFQGKPTRVFAWLGMPKEAAQGRVPGMVLVHGGGGTAFAEWVRLWNERGYAAIAMDTCGSTPDGERGNWARHGFSGPAGWGASFNQTDWLKEDQWTYHAVADAALAHSLLHSLPEVDPDRIGLTGISWGGYLTCIIAGVDARFRFAVPVYGCGFYRDTIAFAEHLNALDTEEADRWMEWWDPSVYLSDTRMPMLWVTGSNDSAYPMNALQKSYRLPSGPRSLCIRLRMPHGHGGAGENPKEIHAFAESILNNEAPLASITAQGRDGDTAWATFESRVPMAKAELNVTSDLGPWPDRQWKALPAQMETPGKVTAAIPDGTQVYYLNLFDSRDLVVSTEHVEMAT